MMANVMMAEAEWENEAVALVAQEISDVCIYLVRLADISGVQLPSALAHKLVRNRSKYPPELVIGGGREAYVNIRNSHRAASKEAVIQNYRYDIMWTMGSMLVGALGAVALQRLFRGNIFTKY